MYGQSIRFCPGSEEVPIPFKYRPYNHSRMKEATRKKVFAYGMVGIMVIVALTAAAAAFA